MNINGKAIQDFLRMNRQNIFFYIVGFIILGLGVNMMKASTLGNGAWDTVTINIRGFFNLNVGWEWVTIGMVSFVISLSLMVIVMSYRQKWRYIFMLVPIFLVAIFIDFWNIVVFQDQELTNTVLQILFYVLGIFVLPFGLTCIIKSSFPAFVFDELMMMFVTIFKAKKITYVRLSIELIGISIGALFGYLTYFHIDGTFGAVDLGSFIFTILFAPIMALNFRILGVKRHG